MLAILAAAAIATASQRELQLALLTAAYDLGACERFMPASFVQEVLPTVLGSDPGAGEAEFAKRGHIAALYVKGRLDKKAVSLDVERCTQLLHDDAERVSRLATGQ